MFTRHYRIMLLAAAVVGSTLGCADPPSAPARDAPEAAQATRNAGLVPVDLGTLNGFSPGRASEARAINQDGDVVGWAEVTGPAYPVPRAVLWRGGQIIDLGTLGGRISRAWGINADGVVVGGALVTGDYFYHAFMWRDGVMTDLGTLATPGPFSIYGSVAYGVDNTGRVVGWSQTSTRATHAFLWEQGTMTDLGTLGGAASVAYAISSSGIVVGSSLTAGGEEHAFMWRNGVMADLGTLGGAKSIAYAVNPSGDIVGSSTTPAGEEHAVLWPKGAGIVDLGTLGRASSVATGINPSGQIVGYFTGAPSSGAFVWQKGVMSELPGVLREVPGFVGEGVPHAYGINAAGEVVGDGVTDYKPHAALWTRQEVARSAAAL